MSRKNSMGSEVAEGYACKPKEPDKDKPVMYSAMHIFICDGKRCSDPESDGLADKVREIIQELGFDKGENRVKVTRTHCNGACRFKKFIYIYRNAKAKNYNEGNCYTAWKQVHLWAKEQWIKLVSSLAIGEIPESLNEFRVMDKVYDDNEKHKKNA